MIFKLYESAAFTVTDYGYGVEIRLGGVGFGPFLQGDDADEVRAALEAYERLSLTSLTDGYDHYLSQYFGDTNHGDTARRLIGERE